MAEQNTAKTERRFIDAKGEATARASAETAAAAIKFLGEEGGELKFSKENFNEGVWNAAAYFGLVTSITNAAGGKHATLSPFERAADRLEGLSGADGEWQGEREGGPQTGIILEALERLGYDKAQVKARLQDGSVKLADLSQAEGVEDTVLAIRAERIEAKRKAAKAAGKPATSLDDLLGAKA